jgi:hypothetical protein
MVNWAAGKYYHAKQVKNDLKRDIYIRFLPTAHVYGKKNTNVSYTMSRLRFDEKNKLKTAKSVDQDKSRSLQPKHMYDSDIQRMEGRPLSKSKYFAFDPNQSEIFAFSGKECDNFLTKDINLNQNKK